MVRVQRVDLRLWTYDCVLLQRVGHFQWANVHYHRELAQVDEDISCWAYRAMWSMNVVEY
jgi:hypothetical protein